MTNHRIAELDDGTYAIFLETPAGLVMTDWFKDYEKFSDYIDQLVEGRKKKANKGIPEPFLKESDEI